MKLKSSLLFFFLLFAIPVFSQQTIKIYDENANPDKVLGTILAKTAENGKHIFIKVGGNWCSWCVRFHKFAEENKAIDSLIKANYEIIAVNYSKENENISFLSRFGYPQRFGFPVFLILDAKGNLLHTQDSGYLEEGKGYAEDKVKRMFIMWSPAAMLQAAKKYGKSAWGAKK